MFYRCKNCGSFELKVNTKYIYHDLYECNNCQHFGYFAISTCCRSPFLIVTKLDYNYEMYSLYHQCLNCGGANKTKHLKSKDYSKQIESEFNKERFDDWKAEKLNERNSIYENIKSVNFSNSRLYKYYEYLNCDSWKEKREKVLERDNFICQCCKIAPAKDVHHLTYKNLFNEQIDDLQALCRKCHVDVHRNNPILD